VWRGCCSTCKASPGLTLLLLAVLAVLVGCAESRRTNLVLVSVDTLRSDHCSAYGYRRDTTPALARLAAGGALFTQAYAPMPVTGPSHATLFTGLYPISHGLTRNGKVLVPEARTLAERLGAAGYETAGFVSSFVLHPRFGFAQGFERYDAGIPKKGATIRRSHWEGHPVAGGFDRRAPRTVRLARQWLEQRSGERPFFLFVHLFDPHFPYSAPPPFGRRFVRGARSSLEAYDGEVAYADHSLGRLLDALDELGLADSTLVVFTADHGEGLGQHGIPAHGAVLYEEALRVPLVLRLPGRIRAGLRRRDLVHLGDVVPTVLELLEIDGPRGDGASLAPALVAGARLEPRPVFFQRRRFIATRIGGRAIRGREFGVREGRWKLIENTETAELELYDLATDPRERRNLAATEPERARDLSARIRDWRAGRGLKAAEGELPHDVREQMRALGYVE
jgi:arylsulfatase A-like enzyme